MSSTKKYHDVNPIPLPYLGILGGLASCGAEICTFGFDNVKTRMQMNGKAGMPTYTGTLHCIQTTLRNNGIPGFYKGVSAALSRQLTYSSVKIYVYEHCKKMFVLDAKDASFVKKVVAGGIAGGIGCVFGNPFDILKIRLINDINGEKYKGFLDCIRQTIAADGYHGFLKGLNVNIARSISINAAELSCFDQFKIIFEKVGMDPTGLLNIFFSSCAAGFFGAFVSSPVDVVKSRFMNQMKAGSAHASATHCAIDVFKYEGVRAFYKGFFPYFARVGPWVVIFFVIYDNLKIKIMVTYY